MTLFIKVLEKKDGLLRKCDIYIFTNPLSSKRAKVKRENTGSRETTPVIPSFYRYVCMCVCKRNVIVEFVSLKIYPVPIANYKTNYLRLNSPKQVTIYHDKCTCKLAKILTLW